MTMLLLLLILIVVLVLVSSATTIQKETISITNSKVLPGNLLPQFLFSQGKVEGGNVVKIGGGRGTAIPFVPDDSCPNDIFDNANEDLRSPQLP